MLFLHLCFLIYQELKSTKELLSSTHILLSSLLFKIYQVPSPAQLAFICSSHLLPLLQSLSRQRETDNSYSVLLSAAPKTRWQWWSPFFYMPAVWCTHPSYRSDTAKKFSLCFLWCSNRTSLEVRQLQKQAVVCTQWLPNSYLQCLPGCQKHWVWGDPFHCHSVSDNFLLHFKHFIKI